MTDRTYNELIETAVSAEAYLVKAQTFIDMLRNVWIVDGYVVGFDYGMFLQRGAMDKATLGRLTEAKIFLSLHAARAARVENGEGELARVIGHETAINMVIRQQESLCEFLRNEIMECGVEMALIRTEWQDRYCREEIERDAAHEVKRHAPVERNPIVTSFVYPPIPVRDFDWQATRDSYEEGDRIGHGRTEQAAIDELLDLEEWDAEAEDDAAQAEFEADYDREEGPGL